MIVAVLFGSMQVISALLYFADRARNSRVIRSLRTPLMGFEAGLGEAWVWSLSRSFGDSSSAAAGAGGTAGGQQHPQQHPHTHPHHHSHMRAEANKLVDYHISAVQGPVVALAALIGVPVARIRAAIPPELLPGSIASAVGRGQGVAPDTLKTELAHLSSARAMGVAGKSSALSSGDLSPKGGAPSPETPFSGGSSAAHGGARSAGGAGVAAHEAKGARLPPREKTASSGGPGRSLAGRVRGPPRAQGSRGAADTESRKSSFDGGSRGLAAHEKPTGTPKKASRGAPMPKTASATSLSELRTVREKKRSSGDLTSLPGGAGAPTPPRYSASAGAGQFDPATPPRSRASRQPSSEQHQSPLSPLARTAASGTDRAKPPPGRAHSTAAGGALIHARSTDQAATGGGGHLPKHAPSAPLTGLGQSAASPAPQRRLISHAAKGADSPPQQSSGAAAQGIQQTLAPPPIRTRMQHNSGRGSGGTTTLARALSDDSAVGTTERGSVRASASVSSSQQQALTPHRGPAGDAAALGAFATPSQGLASLSSDHVLGSALVFALLHIGQAVSAGRLARKQRATALALRGVEAHGRTFDELVDVFEMCLDSLSPTRNWWNRTRLWNFVLLSTKDGWWDPSPGLARALLAARVLPPALSLAARKAEEGGVLGAGEPFDPLATRPLLEAPGSPLRGGGRKHRAGGRRARAHGKAAAAAAANTPQAPANPGGGADETFRQKLLAFALQCVQCQGDPDGGGDGQDEDEDINDAGGGADEAAGLPAGQRACPLQGFSASAIEWSMPGRLRALDGAVPALRLWSTLLSIEALLTLDDHYVVSGDGVGGDETTLADAALRWVAAQAKGCAPLQDLARGLREEARAVVAQWALRQRRLAAASREVYRDYGEEQTRNDLQLHGGKLLAALRGRHETAALLLAPPLEELQRWQRALIVFTALQGMLAIEIWLYWNRGAPLLTTGLRLSSSGT